MAVPPLVALHTAGFDIQRVITRPPARRGRRSEPTPSPVHQAALQLGLDVGHDPAELADSAESEGPSVGVVVAYGAMIRRPVLEVLPMVNLHFSLLPRWRGAAPVERALLAGDRETGVCVMTVAEGLDTGDIHSLARVPIGSRMTSDELARELVEVGTELLVSSLGEGLGPGTAQRGEPTYAEKLSSAEMEIRWSDDVEAIDRLVRLGRAWTTIGGRRLKVLSARPADEASGGVPGAVARSIVTCGWGALELERVQPEGKPAMDAEVWLNGARLDEEAVLGS